MGYQKSELYFNPKDFAKKYTKKERKKGMKGKLKMKI